MIVTQITQGDLFSSHRHGATKDISFASKTGAIILIGCGRRKSSQKSKAQNLYQSRRFIKSIELSLSLNSPYYIISAKHGLLHPDRIVDPYDCDLSEMPKSSQIDWAKDILSGLKRNTNQNELMILTNSMYSEPMKAANEIYSFGYKILSPWTNLDDTEQEIWLDEALHASRRVSDLRSVYAQINNPTHEKNLFKFSDLTAHRLPPRGVYLFIDNNEKNFLGHPGRVVRIGTHAVSQGSKSTLRGRLRNHLGVSTGGGSHRGSIFRLHVGRAMIERTPELRRFASWGIGQDAPAQTRLYEQELENIVSTYIKSLYVFVVNIDDAPSKDSMRALLETSLISLFSDGLEAVDVPSLDWLGRSSPVPQISGSGLWNVRDVSKPYHSISSEIVNKFFPRQFENPK